ncbi:hypothetical protein [Ornithinibacillus sp. JPR2-1]|uniref:hypothetical protein n=1 Tax=Ornithinibacillus sp. JPR2-1 TaxID=2094019 RepID=UPI0031D5D131
MKILFVYLKALILGLFARDKEVSKSPRLLPLDLQFFADPGDPQDPPADPPADPPKQDPSVDPKPDDIMIPKSRFDEVNNNYKSVKEQLDQLLEEKKEEERKEKEQQGEYQSLYEQANEQLQTYKQDFESTKTRAETLEGIITNMLNTKLESIPEEFHDLIPDNLSPEQKLDWITKAETKGLFGTKKSDDPVGGLTNPSTSKTNFEDMNPMQLLAAGYGSKK